MANSPPVQSLIARIELFTSHILLTQYLGQDFPLSSPVFQITNRVKTNEFFSCTSLKGLMTFIGTLSSSIWFNNLQFTLYYICTKCVATESSHNGKKF